MCDMTQLGHHVILTLGKILALTFQGHIIGTWVDLHRRDKHDGVKRIALSKVIKKLLIKSSTWKR